MRATRWKLLRQISKTVMNNASGDIVKIKSVPNFLTVVHNESFLGNYSQEFSYRECITLATPVKTPEHLWNQTSSKRFSTRDLGSSVGPSLSEGEFHTLSDETLHSLHEKIDELGEDLELDGFDSDFSQGVLTVRLGKLGTFVINKQTPNRQIWVSSPVSGPGRFDWIQESGKWVYKRTGAELTSQLGEELRTLLQRDVPF